MTTCPAFWGLLNHKQIPCLYSSKLSCAKGVSQSFVCDFSKHIIFFKTWGGVYTMHGKDMGWGGSALPLRANQPFSSKQTGWKMGLACFASGRISTEQPKEWSEGAWSSFWLLQLSRSGLVSCLHEWLVFCKQFLGGRAGFVDDKHKIGSRLCQRVPADTHTRIFQIHFCILKICEAVYN